MIQDPSSFLSFITAAPAEEPDSAVLKASPGQLSRRGLLAGAGALVLALSLKPRGATAAEKGFGADGMPHGWRDDPTLFVAIAPDGTVTVTCTRAEMGQGVRTSVALVIADELEADWAKVKVTQAHGDEERFGNQDTDGSRSLRHFFMPLRRAGAAARTMLVEAAAKQWSVPASEITAENHALVHAKSGRRIGFGEVAQAAASVPVPDRSKVTLKDPSAFRYIGKGRIGLIDNVGITTGTAQYGLDTRVEGMLYAVVARPPVFGGKVKSFDEAAALKVPGVVKVVTIDPPAPPYEFMPTGGVAVIARNTWAAIKGREALNATFDDGPNAAYDSDAYRATLEQAVRKPGKVVRQEGDVDAAMKKAAKRLEAEYYIPHLVQAPMEPPAATVRIAKDGKIEAWGCVQSPQAARDRIAKRLGIDPKNVTVNVTLLGGGFGRKSKPDYFVEAALCSKAVDGAPVKMTWTREDDLHNGYYHTVSVERLEAGLDDKGMPIAWLHRSAAPTIGSTFVAGANEQIPIELGMGLVNVPFNIPNMRMENPPADAHVRIGWFRSVSNIPRAFAVQSFLAELAHMAGRDPKDYLLDVIGPARILDPVKLGDAWNYGEDPSRYPYDTGRLRNVIEAVAQGAGWGRKVEKGRGLGIAAHYSFVTYTAAVAEVEVGPKGEVTVQRVDIAIDSGQQVNPERVRSQLEGAVVMGMGLALTAQITFKNGRAVQDNYDTYELTRINDAPKIINVHLVQGGGWDKPLGGVGEPGVPPVAPAIANAIFAATGRRIRQLPMRDKLSA